MFLSNGASDHPLLVLVLLGELDYFGFKVEMGWPDMPFPRQGDELLMMIFQRAGVSEATLRSLNCC